MDEWMGLGTIVILPFYPMLIDAYAYILHHVIAVAVAMCVHVNTYT